MCEGIGICPDLAPAAQVDHRADADEVVGRHAAGAKVVVIARAQEAPPTGWTIGRLVAAEVAHVDAAGDGDAVALARFERCLAIRDTLNGHSYSSSMRRRLALMSERRRLPSSRRLIEALVGLVGLRRLGLRGGDDLLVRLPCEARVVLMCQLPFHHSHLPSIPSAS